MRNQKTKRIIKALIIVIVLLIILAIIAIVIGFENNKNSPKTSVDDFINAREIAEYYNCEFIGTKKSEEEGFKKDLYLYFPDNPINDYGGTNKYRYERIIGAISAKMNNKSFRIIDESRNIIVRVYANNNKKTYTINNDASFFEHLRSNYSIENELVESITPVNVNSNLLNSLINNIWRTTNLNIGTMDSSIDKYDIYFDEGYKIRKINGLVYNIIFTNKYNENVVNNLRTNSSFEEIQNVLGQATYESEINSQSSVIGYKTEKFYIFFSQDEISIYPNKGINNQDEFAALVSKYIEDKNLNEFLSKLTDIWPDYSNYMIDQLMIYIDYPLKGIEINSNATGLAITVYNNYNGKITNDITVDDIKSNKILPSNINLSLNNNSVFNDEMSRLALETNVRILSDKTEDIKTNLYMVYLYEKENRCEFYSCDKTNIDSTIYVEGLNNIYNLNDYVFIYSLNGKGIYEYNAITMETKEIVTGKDNFNITKIEDNTLYYDNTKIEVNI